MDEFLTVAEVAEILKLNQQTVRNWIKSGIPDLRHYLDSRVIRIGPRRHRSLGRTWGWEFG